MQCKEQQHRWVCKAGRTGNVLVPQRKMNLAWRHSPFEWLIFRIAIFQREVSSGQANRSAANESNYSKLLGNYQLSARVYFFNGNFSLWPSLLKLYNRANLTTLRLFFSYFFFFSCQRDCEKKVSYAHFPSREGGFVTSTAFFEMYFLMYFLLM